MPAIGGLNRDEPGQEKRPTFQVSLFSWRAISEEVRTYFAYTPNLTSRTSATPESSTTTFNAFVALSSTAASA